MPTYEFKATIPEDHYLRLPDEIPMGEAQVQVTIQQSNSATDKLITVIEKILKTPRPSRSKADIDAELSRERKS